MINILHMSDFHLSDKTGWTFSDSELRNLSDALKDIKLDYLVFTGDLIDGESIFVKARDYADKIAAGLASAKSVDKLNSMIKADSFDSTRGTIIRVYNELVTKEYYQAFEKAAVFLLDLIKHLGISRDRVIICPGNHDAMRLLSLESQFPECNSPEVDSAIKEMREKYLDPFNRLCDKLDISGKGENTLIQRDDVNFLCINTNYPIRNHYCPELSCLNCNSLKDILISNRDNLCNGIPCVTISHEPIESVCENVEFDFSDDGKSEPLFEVIEKVSNFMLSGDKHATREKVEKHSVSVTCGKPLGGEQVYYALHQIGENSSTQYIKRRGASWEIVPTLRVCTEVYDMSKMYIKDLSYKFACGSSLTQKDISKLKVFSELLKNCDPSRLKRTSDFFLHGAHMIPREESSEKIIKSQTICETVCSHFRENNEFSLSGNPGVGKSTLLGVIYMELLMDFETGNSHFLPFYYNIQFDQKPEETPDCQNDPMPFYSEKKKEIGEFIDRCYEYSSQKGWTPIIIIDGMEKKLLWGNSNEVESIEHFVMEKLDSLDDEKASDFTESPKHLFGIDDFTDLSQSINEAFDSREQNGIRLDGVMLSLMDRYKNRFIDMVENYFALFDSPEGAREKAVKLYEICKTRRITDVDYHFLESNALKVLENEDFSIEQWLSAKVYEMYTNFVRGRMERCAYEIEFNGSSYLECCQIINEGDKKINYWDFAKLKNKPDIRKYLAAAYLSTALKDWSSEKLSLLDNFIDRRIMSYLRYIVKNRQNLLARVNSMYAEIENRKIELSGLALCNLAYLFSECQKDGTLLFSQNHHVDEITTELCNHSMKIATIIASTDKLSACNYIEDLISDVKGREFVRFYQRRYYGDLDGKKWTKFTGDCLQEGFDFFKCFQTLSVKIDNYLSSNRRYNLLEYDLFTLCDLTFSRLKIPLSEDINREDKSTLFYNSSYVVRKQILDCLVGLLKAYLSSSANQPDMVSCHLHPLIYHYFDFAKDQLENVLGIIDEDGSNENELLVTSSRQYNSLLMYLNSERLGWRIRSRMKGLSKEDYDKLAQENCVYGFNHKCEPAERREKDATMERVVFTESENNKVASVLMIAQLFLPKSCDYLSIPNEPSYQSIDCTKYDKSLIMAFLLLRHCGKGLSGDCTPASSKEYLEKNKESEHQHTCDALMPFILQGGTELDEVFELINADYNQEEQDNINLKIANEIEIIQLEYQYYLICEQYANKFHKAHYFDSEREEEFKKFFEGKIHFCKHIEKTLIKENSLFKDVLLN